MSTNIFHFYLLCLGVREWMEEKRLGVFIKHVFGRYKDKGGIHGNTIEKVLCPRKGRARR